MRSIAQRIGVNVASVSRHFSKCAAEDFAEAQRAGKVADVVSTLEEVARTLEDVRRLASKAERSKQIQAAINALGQLLKGLALKAQLKGELRPDEGGSAAEVALVLLMLREVSHACPTCGPEMQRRLREARGGAAVEVLALPAGRGRGGDGE